MSRDAFDAAVAGESVLVTETLMEPLQLLGRVGSATFVIEGSRRELSPQSLNPYELLGAALASCTAMTMRLYADQHGFPLVRVQVSVSHHPGGAHGHALLERTIIAEGPLTAAERRQLLEAARRSPIDETLTHGAEIRTRVSEGDSPSLAPATSDYLRDIEQAVGDIRETAHRIS